MFDFMSVLKMAAAVAVTATLMGGATAVASGGWGGSLAKSSEPANVSDVMADVKTYYGGTVDADGHAHASNDSQWFKDVKSKIDGATTYLDYRVRNGTKNPAIVLDVDDTSVVTYGWEVDNHYYYDAKVNEEAILANEFPTILPTMELAKHAKENGVKVYFITGRPEHQRNMTLADLAELGYPQPDGLFLKPETGTTLPWLSCALPKCTTVEFKSQTRKHISALGDKVVVNVGDQYSDLRGGYADLAVKLPNPMYDLG
jgi:hypothetical protein